MKVGHNTWYGTLGRSKHHIETKKIGDALKHSWKYPLRKGKSLVGLIAKYQQALERRTRKERIEYEESYQRIIVRKKARKQAKQQRNIITYLNSYLCIRENNRTITSDQSELKQGNDGRMKEKECKKYRKKERLLIKKSCEFSNVDYYSVKRHE